MRNDRNDRNDRRDKDSGSNYDKRAGTKGTGDKTVDRRYKEAQDQANRDREEQQGKDKEV